MKEPPMIVLVFASIIGGVATAVAASTLGIIAALSLAPIGGSLTAGAVAVVLAARSARRSPVVEPVAIFPVDEQVIALRQVSGYMRQPAPHAPTEPSTDTRAA
jgi:hypothetical protein